MDNTVKGSVIFTPFEKGSNPVKHRDELIQAWGGLASAQHVFGRGCAGFDALAKSGGVLTDEAKDAMRRAQLSDLWHEDYARAFNHFRANY